MRIYLIKVNADSSDDYTNKEFINEAMLNGKIYTLKSFQEAWNYTEAFTKQQDYYIRIIK